MGTSFLGEPIFWAFVAAMAAGLVALYYILRQALVDALDEHAKHERERTRNEKRGGGLR